MAVLQPIKDTTRYLWHDSATLRFCCKLIACPLFCPYYCLLIWVEMCSSKRHYIPYGKQLKRWGIMADIKHRRRVRRVGRRKRSISVDGKGPWNSKAKDQSQSPLFAKLPAELRLKIYEMVLCDEEELVMKFNEDEPWDCWDVRAEVGCDTRMLRTCKKIYREAAPVLYSRNTFRFDSYKLLSIFMSTIPPQHLASIRQVVFVITLFWNRSDGFTGWYRDLLPLLGGMQGLREVCLRYRLRENSYVVHPRSADFTLLEWLEEKEKPSTYAMLYEILEVQIGPEIGGMLFDRWTVGERRKIDMKK